MEREELSWPAGGHITCTWTHKDTHAESSAGQKQNLRSVQGKKARGGRISFEL